VAAEARAVAKARVHGKVMLVGTGRMAHPKLTLKLARLHRGRYQLTLLELRPHRNAVVIGHTTLTVS
jgi:predicted ThiF/HesA family dinucleotide-utilizing enzyme